MKLRSNTVPKYMYQVLVNFLVNKQKQNFLHSFPESSVTYWNCRLRKLHISGYFYTKPLQTAPTVWSNYLRGKEAALNNNEAILISQQLPRYGRQSFLIRRHFFSSFFLARSGPNPAPIPDEQRPGDKSSERGECVLSAREFLFYCANRSNRYAADAQGLNIINPEGILTLSAEDFKTIHEMLILWCLNKLYISGASAIN